MKSTYKVCKDCGKKKPLREFSEKYRNSGSPTHRPQCRICLGKKNQAAKHERRKAVVEKYGGQCTCCGENTYEFLSIDHVNGGGTTERRGGGKRNPDIPKVLSGRQLVELLFRAPEIFPEYQILCHNCNFAKGVYGICPHKVS